MRKCQLVFLYPYQSVAEKREDGKGRKGEWRKAVPNVPNVESA